MQKPLQFSAIKWAFLHTIKCNISLTLMHSERPKLYGVLAFLSAIGLLITVLFEQQGPGVKVLIKYLLHRILRMRFFHHHLYLHG